MRPLRPATCHPKYKLYRKGLCSSCYAKERWQIRKARAAIPETGQALQLPPVISVGRPRTVSEPRPLSPPLVTVHLQMRHTVNGHVFGPGPVKLSPGQAEAFLHTEHEANAKEISLTQQQAFIIQYGPSGQPIRRQVPWAQFDVIMSRE